MKNSDEIYKICPSCDKLIKWEAVICPYCGVQVKELVVSGKYVTKEQKIGISPKNKSVAVILAIFFGFWAWLYTYKKNASNFWIVFVINIIFSTTYMVTFSYSMTKFIENNLEPNLGWWISFSIIYFIWAVASWIWVIIDNARKPDIFFSNYPKS